MGKLNKEEIVTLQVLKQKGESNRAIARRLGVHESAVRYHLRRQSSGADDGRKKQTLVEKLGLVEVVNHWWHLQCEALPNGRSPNITGLWQFLKDEHDYGGSYKSVRKYVCESFPKPKLRAFRRVETPPGAQTQSDWMEFKVNIGYAECVAVRLDNGPIKNARIEAAFAQASSICGHRLKLWALQIPFQLH